MPLRLYHLTALIHLALVPSAVLAQDPDSGGERPIEDTSMVLQGDKIEQQMDAFYAKHDLAGVLYMKKDGELVLQKAFGLANPQTERANRIDTIFGIGSRPIDFTIAATYLLAQRGQLSLDDPISTFYPDAPADRAGIKIRHLMTGQSGLPDFPAQPTDYDADLAWISRAELERRTMAVDLLFAPGSNEAHSHWAFGLLAAIIERVSNRSYEQFLQEEFFDPAEMNRTGSYGQRGAHAVTDFAVGGGKQVGLPNIPPNWGPTSWLVKGSGGMYSNLDDLLKFYAFVSSGEVLKGQYSEHFRQPAANVDGSERGFELMSYSSKDRDDVLFAFFNKNGRHAVERLLSPTIDYLGSD